MRRRGSVRRRRLAARPLCAAVGVLTMRFTPTEEQEALRRQARQLLRQHSPSAAVRRAMASERGWEPELWARLVELGWTALLVPEELGGLGLGWVELVAIFEEAGGALLCAPLFSTVALATNLLLLAGGAE